MTEPANHLIANTLGHAAGILIFGHFLVLAVWNRPLSRIRASRLAILAAIFAFLWNLLSFAVLAIHAPELVERTIAGAGFCVLSLLPAVLLHLCLTNRFPALVRSGYVLSALSIAAHAAELFRGAPVYHRLGLGLITVGFGVLTVVSVMRIFWSGDGNPRLASSRLFAAMSLFLFAISFVHFGEGQSHDAWSTELLIHHAGIPLALFILLQDYRFVLVDAFIRFLANGLLASLFAVVIVLASERLTFAGQVLLTGALLAAFAVTRGLVQDFLSRIVFRRTHPESLLRDLRAAGARAAGEEPYVDEATRRVAQFMDTTVVEAKGGGLILDSLDLVAPVLVTEVPEARELRRDGAVVLVPVRMAHGLTRHIVLGERRGGKRYLSEDLQVLARLAACVAEQADQIREAEMRRLVSHAELRALQSQIHPHFLFNALNALYGIIPREARAARRMLLNLADIFRYFLQTDKEYIALEEELRIVKAYLAIEELRLGDKLKVRIDVDDAARRELIPVLSIQPLVENAVKHGVAARPEGGSVGVTVQCQDGGLRISVHDTGPGFAAPRSRPRAAVGLENVSRRLELCYGASAQLQVQSSGEGTTVSFVTKPALAAVERDPNYTAATVRE